MLIRFSDHCSEIYQEGCIEELKEMGADVESQDQITFAIKVNKAKNYSNIIAFLHHKQQKG
jgi:hypothetical protein